MSFHIVEAARLLDGPMGSARGAGLFGAFVFPSPEPGWTLQVIADDGALTGWEHVSVTARRKDQARIPTWKEMVCIKDLHWDPEDVVVQFHPARSEYVNRHPAVLHLWRHRTTPFPTPDPTLVG